MNNVKIGDVWKSVSDIWVKIDGDWKKALKVSVKIDGSWKTSQLWGVWVTDSNWDQIVNYGGMAYTGIKDAIILTGGHNSRPSSGMYSSTGRDECYIFNGSSWSEASAMPGWKRYHCAFGYQASSVVTSGSKYTSQTFSLNYCQKTYKFNGTSWSTSGNSSSNRETPCSTGEQNAGLFGLGRWDTEDDFGYHKSTQKFNGSSWSSAGDVTPNGSDTRNMGGNSSAGILGGGSDSYMGYISKITYLYNGSTWSSTTQMIRNCVGYMGCGPQNNFMATSGRPMGSSTAYLNSEVYNGTTWKIDDASISQGFSNGYFGTGLTREGAYVCSGTTSKVEKYIYG